MQDKNFIKGSIYRSDLDHPNSLHNTTAGQSDKMQVQVPKSQVGPSKTQLNGFYDKETLSVTNGFKEHTTKGIGPMDPRFGTNENYNIANRNKLY